MERIFNPVASSWMPPARNRVIRRADARFQRSLETASPHDLREQRVHVLLVALLANAGEEKAYLGLGGGPGHAIDDPVTAELEPPVRVERARELLAGLLGFSFAARRRVPA